MRRPALYALTTLLAVSTPSLPTRATELEFVQAFVNGTNGVEGMRRAINATVSPDGAHVYVAGRGDDSIAIFSRHRATGALTFLGRSTWTGSSLPGGTVPDLDSPATSDFDPDGVHLYVPARRSVPGSSIVIFERSAATGALTFLGSLVNGIGGVSGIENAQSLTVSADGANVYVPGFDASAVIVYARNAATGGLTEIDAEADGVAGVDGLEAPMQVAESPDGNFVYVASQSRPVVLPGLGGITVFERDAAGALTFVELQQQGSGGVDGLWAPRDVAVSPDGLHVYTVNYGRGNEVPPKPGGMAVFARDPADGTLTFLDSYTETELGVIHPTSLAIDPDGSSVYLVAQGEIGIYVGSLTVLSRNPVTGALTGSQVFVDNVGGVDGLAGSFSVDLSPDGANAYVSSEQEPRGNDLRGALAVFRAPEPGAAATAGTALLALAWLGAHSSRSSQSRGRRNSS